MATTNHDQGSSGWNDVVDNLPIGVFRSTPDGRILNANAALVALLGFGSVEELLGVNARDVYTQPGVRDGNVTATEGGADRFDFENTVLRRDGSTVEVRVNARVRRNEDGSIAFYEGIVEDVAERRRLDRALRFEEAILGAAFEESPLGMALMDPDRRALRVNQAMCRMLGRSEADVLGAQLERFLHADDEPKGLRRFEQLETGERDSYRVERRLVHPDGTVVWVNLTVSAIRDDSGDLVAVLSQAVDVSDRRHAEDSLLRNEAAFRALVDAIPDPIFHFDRSGTFVGFHHGSRLPPTIEPDEFLGRTLHDFYPDEVATRIVAAINRVIDWEENETVEYPDLEAAGRLFAADLSRISDDEVMALVREITDQRRQEEAADRMRDEMAALQDAAPLHVVVVSADGQILELRESAKAPRLPAIEWVGGSMYDLVPDQADAIQRMFDAVIATGEPREFELSFTTDVERIYRVGVTRYGDDRVLAAVQDVTEERAAEKALREQLSARDEFVASVSHELRDPLATVVGLASEMRDRLDDFERDELAELIALIADQSGEMAGVVDDLLVATRADLSKLDVAPSSVDLAGVIDAVLRAVPHGDVEVVLPVEPCVAFADAARVRQVVRNLVTNATRYGGDRVEIEVSGVEDGRHRLVVRDDGARIPDAVRTAMFSPFERGAAVTGGAGLGLTVARKLARLMGGDLTYDHVDGWSTFTFTLPAATE